jgi:hypothetical protein
MGMRRNANKAVVPPDDAPEGTKRGKAVVVKIPRGRPPKYKPEYPNIIREVCKRIAPTDSEIGAILGVCERQVRRWRATYPEFRAACKTSIAAWVARTERTGWEMANGFSVRSGEWDTPKDGPPRWLEKDEYIEPNFQALEMMLATHAPDRYKRRGIQIGIGAGGDLSFSFLVEGSMAPPAAKMVDASPAPPALPSPTATPEKVGTK